MAYTVLDQKKTQRSEIAKVTNLWTKLLSPLQFLTKTNIRTMLEESKCGNDSRLQVAFYSLERQMPIYGIVIQRRLAGIRERRWKITPLYPDSQRSVEQAEAVQEMFKECDARNQHGLTEAIAHLAMASFRGRSAVKPTIAGDDLLFYNLENWNFLEWNGSIYFVPDSEKMLFLPGLTSEMPDGVSKIPPHEVAWVKEERPIDIPGIEIYLRQTIGEDAWSRATERYGLAQVIITAPDGTPDSALPMWAERALRVLEGGSGVLPPGANVNQLTDARGQDPFSKYIEHQTEMIVLLACGSTLGTLAGATGLGSGLAELQKGTFGSLISLDCKRIANALTDSAVRKCVNHLGSEDLLCRFDFVEPPKLEAKDAWSIAIDAESRGYSVDYDELHETYPELSFVKKDDQGDTKEPPKEEEWSPSNTDTGDGDGK